LIEGEKMEITELRREEEKAWDEYVHNLTIPLFTTK